MITSRLGADPTEVSGHYDDLDPAYRAIWGEHLHHGLWVQGNESQSEAVSRLARELMNWLAPPSGCRVCDIGCGYGATSQLLADEYACHVTGLSLSLRQVERASFRNAKNGSLRFLQMDWLRNTLEDSSFERAFSIESSEHMPDKPRFFREARRILKPGGVLVIFAWLRSEATGSLQDDWLLRPLCHEGRIAGLATATEYRDWLHDQGFELERYENLTRQVQRTWQIASRRALAHFVLNPRNLRILRSARSRDFLRSLVRIRLAYATGAMTYAAFRAVKRA